jgi:poly-gamma-glutamate synthesis protein (capsule biosynthesis protein)
MEKDVDKRRGAALRLFETPVRASGEPKGSPRRFVLLSFALILVLALSLGACFGCTDTGSSRLVAPTDGLAAADQRLVEGSSLTSQSVSVSFAVAGDCFIHSSIYYNYAKDDGSHDFTAAYTPVKSLVEAADLACVTQGSVCGGTELGLSDEPHFNSPFEALDALATTGFDWVNTASTHSFDRGESTVLSQLDHLATLPALTQTGTNRSSADAQVPAVIERNGLSIGVASYTLGLNGFELPSGKDYLVNLGQRERMRSDIEQLVEQSDVQMVNVQWGARLDQGPTDEQRELAAFLSDLGVDIVVASDARTVQPVTLITGEAGNQTLVMYSLGNFFSAEGDRSLVLGALVSGNIVYQPRDKSVSFEGVEIHPVVSHINQNWDVHVVYPLADYTDTLAAEHVYSGSGLTRDYLVAQSTEAFGTEFPLIH